MSILKKLIFWVAGLLAAAFCVAWLLLSSSVLAGPRATLTEWLISRETGQTIEINGGVSIDLGSIVRVSAKGLRVPGKMGVDDDLANVTSLDFDVALSELVMGDLQLSQVVLDGADIMLSVDKDGTPSWPIAQQPQDMAEKYKQTGALNPGAALSNILSDHRLQMFNSGISFRDAKSGFEFDLRLTDLGLSRQSASAPIDLKATGMLNGQALDLSGEFSPNAPFKGQLSFESIQIDATGTPDQQGYEAGFRTAINASIDDLQQLQKILLLDDVLEGTAHANAEIVYEDGKLFVGNADALISLIGGQSVVLARTLGPSGGPGDATLDTTIRLFPEDNEPPATTVRRDLKLVSIYMQLANRIDDVPLRKMVIATNGMVIDTAGVGPPPITVSDVSRSQDGLLRLGDVVFRIGPTDAPFLVLQGAVNDALQMAQVDVEGDLTLPLASLLSPEIFQESGVLGQVSGGFRLTGSRDMLVLSDLKGDSGDADLWHFDVSGSVGDILTLNDINVQVTARVPSGSDLLTALELEPIDTGAVKIDASLVSQEADWDALATVAVSDSELIFDVSLDAAIPNPIVRGSVTSDLIQVNHIRDIVAAVLQIGRLGDIESQSKQAADADGNEDQAGPVTSGSGPFRDVTLQPLGRAILLSGMDLAIGIDLKKIEGDKGSTSLKSDLLLDGSKAQLGPVEFAYGGGQFNLTGKVDLKENPEILQIAGSTGGWDLGKIMQSLKFKKGVSGILNANLELSGDHASVQDFMKTAQGWATVSMRKGSIETQLLDIAGLGVLPWLFSKGKGDRAPIVCLRAPMHVSNGRVSSKEIVVETDMVQIVVYGDVNLGKKTLDIHGQPRRIGKPLSRSPWPFSVSGALADPKVKVKDGPRRVKRKDGASTMPAQRKLCIADILQLK
ncbi:AsmA family protein [Shimia gijangensis]|uniref:AsmA family protein n=1 Tax=Shimia gijangensis TaxID=1470563 RepID=A0A1M6CFY2_9RHOB|nr:AsmA family protein [Shimia gijangensis]SHI59945.1 AsmA family protein [Shimia gijangensis]